MLEKLTNLIACNNVFFTEKTRLLNIKRSIDLITTEGTSRWRGHLAGGSYCLYSRGLFSMFIFNNEI
jgi:hypothetical protein